LPEDRFDYAIAAREAPITNNVQGRSEYPLDRTERGERAPGRREGRALVQWTPVEGGGGGGREEKWWGEQAAA